MTRCGLKLCRALVMGCALISSSAWSFQILPQISDVDRKLTSVGSNGCLLCSGLILMDTSIGDNSSQREPARNDPYT